MNVTRLFVPFRLEADQSARLDGDQARYLSRVMRMRVGDEFTVFDGTGCEFPAEIVNLEKQCVNIQVGQPRPTDRESPLKIHLVQGVSRSERMDFVVQKTTELGINRITPVMTERSVVRLNNERARKRHQHWLRIAQNACEQCGRNIVPQIDEPLPLTEWLDGESAGGQRRILLRPSAANTLSELEPGPQILVVLIGPEGGLSEMEYGKAEFAKFQAVSMGPRILRTETAALAAIAILQSRLGDLE